MTSRDAAKQAMEERILETIDRLFYGQGIRAVGVDTIAAEIGISKRTLYNYFPSKDALIVAYLTRRAVPRSASDRPPLEQILGVFDWLERWFASKTFRGCPFVNAVAELGERTHPATKLAVDYKDRRRLAFRDILAGFGVADPEGLAIQLVILVEGAIAAALVRGDPAMARAAKVAARVLLTAAGVPDGSETGTVPKKISRQQDSKSKPRRSRKNRGALAPAIMRQSGDSVLRPRPSAN
jgi:AcrR family transcriptional regulator